MTITTSKQKTFDVNWAWAPVGEDGDMMFELTRDERPVSQIAADFEGCEHIHRESELEGDKDFDGYTRVKSVVVNPRRGTVRLTLMKGGDAA